MGTTTELPKRRRAVAVAAALLVSTVEICASSALLGAIGVTALGSETVRVEDDIIYFYVSRPRKISYVYRALMAKNFGGVLESRYDKIELVPSDPIDGCQDFGNAALVAGQMALMERGMCSFAEKAWHAQQAGAVAALIYDSDRTNGERWVDMVRDQEGYIVTIPSMFVLGREGFKIIDGLRAANTFSATIRIPVNSSHISPHEYYPGVLW
mmetsp:Transcript_15266/g.39259  ORF Transcript_15266/g.39259 Transcript_15266/m.39259 type:complete len:211 (-) Transcript_15266:2116-2748(-)